MNKQEYLKQLQLALSNYDKSLQDEILNDYQEHFSIGHSEGRSETEIIASLGDIRGLIEDLGEPKQIRSKIDVTENDHQTSTVKCKKVYVDAFSADIRVVLSSNQFIKAKYENSGSPKEQLMYQFTGEQRGDTFFIKIDVKDKMPFFSGLHTFRTPNMSIDLELPSGVELLQISGISGDISLDHLTVDMLVIKTVSGDVFIESCTAEKTQINATSGDIELCSMLGILNLKTVSGDTTITKHMHGEIQLSSASGDISYDGNSKSIFTNTVSGDIELNLQQDGTITTSTVSGDTDVHLPSTTKGLDLSFTSLSGVFHSHHPLIKLKGAKGTYQFGLSGSILNAKSISGDINLY